MANLTQTIPHYIGGVSKYPDDKKDPGQLRDCQNGYPDPTFGMTKRPGFKHIKSFGASEAAHTNGKWFHIHRDADENYIGCIKAASIAITTASANGTSGTYLNVATTTSGSGTGMTVDVVITSGSATSITINTAGIDYASNDTLTIDKANVGNTTANIVGTLTLGGLNIWNADSGVEATFSPAITAANLSYLTGQNVVDYDIKTIQDTSIITNKTIKASMSAATSFTANRQGTVFIKSVLNSTAYTVTVDSTTSTITSDSNATISEIISALETEINSKNITGLTVSAQDTSLELTKTTAFDLKATAGSDDTGVFVYQDAVSVFTSLPERSKNGRVVKILNTNADEDDFWVKFVGTNGTDGTGNWEECVAPGVSTGFDPKTMPHELINTEKNKFKFQQISWDLRNTGNTITNQNPSFVDKKLQQVFFHSNRLGILCQDNVIFSQAGEFYRFFRESSRIQIDSDPIDANCSSIRPVVLHGAVSSAQGLILFSKNQQFLLTSINGPLTPTTVDIKSVSNYEMDTDIDPVDNGTNLIFVSKTPGFTRIYQLFTQGQERNPQIEDIGKIISEWIPETIEHIVTSPQNTFIALYGTKTKDLYFYRSYSEAMLLYNPGGRNKKMSAWFRWSLPGEVQFVVVDSDIMYAVTTQGGEYTLLSASINQTPEETVLVNSDGEKINPCMDLYAIAKSAPYQAMDTLTITTAGNGWTSAPPITLTPTQTGEGSGATATCTIATVGGTAGVVNAVTITAVGSGYSQGINVVVGEPWKQSEAYVVGDQVVNGGKIYTCDTNGESAASGNGPTGDTPNITDGTTQWDFAGVQTVITPTVYDGTKCYIPFKNDADLTPVLTVGSDVAEIEDGADFVESGFTVNPTRGSDDTGEYFSVFDKDLSAVADKVVLGYSYIYDLTLPRTYFRNQNGSDFSAILVINRYKFSVGLSGVVGFKLLPKGGTEWTDVSSTIDAQQYLANDVPLEDQSILTVPIHQKNTNFTLRVYSESPFPVSLTSMMWEGNYSPRYYRRA